MVQQITLYTAKICPYAHRVELALVEVGAVFRRYELNLESKPEWYAQKINPASKVPAIAYGGPVVPADQPSPDSVKLAESLVLVEFVADLFPEAPFYPAYNGMLWRGESKDAVLSSIEALQSLLAEGKSCKFAVSDEFTIADVTVLPFFARMEVAFGNDLGAYAPGEGQKVLDALATDARFAAYREYLPRLKERESFKATWHPDHVKKMMTGFYGSLRLRDQK